MRQLTSVELQLYLRDDAPICRFVSGSVTLDVMPIAEDILGFSNPW